MSRRILVVCLGNICRSPLAQGIFEFYSKDKEFFIDSAATSNYHQNARPDHRSIKVGLKHNIDISSQRSRQIKGIDFLDFDEIYAVDQSVFETLLKLAPEKHLKNKVKMIDNRDVHDPYYGDEDDFEAVFQQLNSCIQKLIS
ncbi:MAG: low molecular weight protein-tyrosine-phosphatase [Flavobacteriaceae bacterium]